MNAGAISWHALDGGRDQTSLRTGRTEQPKCPSDLSPCHSAYCAGRRGTRRGPRLTRVTQSRGQSRIEDVEVSSKRDPLTRCRAQDFTNRTNDELRLINVNVVTSTG